MKERIKKPDPKWVVHLARNGMLCECCGEMENSFSPYACNCHTHGMEQYNHLDFQIVLDFDNDIIMSILNYFCQCVHDGERFHDGDIVENLSPNFPLQLQEFEESGRKILRVIIPDEKNRFPGDQGCSYPFTIQGVDTNLLCRNGSSKAIYHSRKMNLLAHKNTVINFQHTADPSKGYDDAYDNAVFLVRYIHSAENEEYLPIDNEAVFDEKSGRWCAQDYIPYDNYQSMMWEFYDDNDLIYRFWKENPDASYRESYQVLYCDGEDDTIVSGWVIVTEYEKKRCRATTIAINNVTKKNIERLNEALVYWHLNGELQFGDVKMPLSNWEKNEYLHYRKQEQ